MAKAKKTACRKCAECIHEYACQMWNVGNINQMDATHCTGYEAVKDSAAYFCGWLKGLENIRCGNCKHSAVTSVSKREVACTKFAIEHLKAEHTCVFAEKKEGLNEI